MPAGVELLTAYVSIVTETSKIAPEVKKSFGQVGREADRAGRDSGKRFSGAFGRGLKSTAGILGVGAVGAGVISFLKDSNAEAREAQKAGALTAQAIKSTGGAANVSAKQVGTLATAISNKVGIDDEAIQSGENLLLTFKNVRNEAGKGNNIFTQATRSFVDLAAGMAAASGGEVDFRSATTLVGKALNDPIKGLTALSRVGVTFTQGQKDQIKQLVESGHRMKAQKIILRELRSEFGGAAKSQATEGAKAAVAIGNLKEQIGTALLPVVDKLARFTSQKAVPAISEFVTGMQDGTGAGGEFVDVLEDAVGVGKGVLKFFNSIPGPVKKYGAELLVAGVLLNKVNNGLTSGVTALTGWGKQLGNAEATMARTQKTSYALGVGLRNLAGAGGMIAIVDGTKRAGSAVGVLETTLGGAAAGFAAGGPVGAGIGTGIGLFLSLKSAISGTNDVKMPSPKQLGITDIIGALDEADAAATRFNKNQIFDFLSGKTKGAPPKGVSVGTTISATAKLYGIPDRQIVQAMTGNVKAFEAIKARFAKAAKHDPLGVVPTDRTAVLGSIRTTLKAYRDEREQVLKNIAATTDYGHKLDALPDKKQTKVEATGIVPTVKGIAAVAAKIHATPTEVDTLISASGVKTTRAAVQKVIDKTNEYGRLHPNPKIDANTSPARAKVAAWIKDLNRILSGNFTALIHASTTKPPGKAAGGSVIAGHPYIVGETRPELFVPNQNGRIIPRVPASVGATGGGRLALTITNWDEGTGHMEWIADSRVDAAAAMQGETVRAFG